MSLRSISRRERRARARAIIRGGPAGLLHYRDARLCGMLLALPGRHVVTVIDLRTLLRALATAGTLTA